GDGSQHSAMAHPAGGATGLPGQRPAGAGGLRGGRRHRTGPRGPVGDHRGSRRARRAGCGWCILEDRDDAGPDAVAPPPAV
ncbi:MAG: hypothetical protein AVDCRST_MAG18-4097, partial [uncultured Thermomicrobiales bacterium]